MDSVEAEGDDGGELAILKILVQGERWQFEVMADVDANAMANG